VLAPLRSSIPSGGLPPRAEHSAPGSAALAVATVPAWANARGATDNRASCPAGKRNARPVL